MNQHELEYIADALRRFTGMMAEDAEFLRSLASLHYHYLEALMEVGFSRHEALEIVAHSGGVRTQG